MMVVHAFNPSPREEPKREEDSSQTQSPSEIPVGQEVGSPFQTEVEVRASGWLF